MKIKVFKFFSYTRLITLLLGCEDNNIAPTQEHYIGEKFDDGVIFHVFKDSKALS